MAHLVPPQASSRLNPAKKTSETFLGCLFYENRHTPASWLEWAFVARYALPHHANSQRTK
jgi:hypothetical protein